MELNQTALRGILAAVLSVDQKYIVPKQGNWFNPQEENANVANWCAYRIKSNRPRTAPFYDNGTESGQAVSGVVVQKIAEIELQFVGPQSEDLAQSVAMWPLRSDVQAQFQNVQGAIMYDTYDAISSVFMQDGNNTVTAWNVTIRVLWYSIMDTNQVKILTINTGGRINV